MPDDTLYAIDTMVNDVVLQGRIRAGTAQKEAEGFNIPGGDITRWVYDNRYEICSAPGWGADYQYALDTGNENPGKDPAVISDDEIRSQVQLLLEPSRKT